MIEVQLLAAVALTKIDLTDQPFRAKLPEAIDRAQRVLRLFGGYPDADHRHGSNFLAKTDFGCVLAVSRSGSGNRASCDAQLNSLLNLDALRERIRPWPGQRAHIGFVGGIGPVAMVLHLERVAFHRACGPDARRHLMGQSADIAKRAVRIDLCGEFRQLLAAVDVEHLQRAAGDALQRMQDNEAGAVGLDICQGLGDHLEGERAVIAAINPGFVDEGAFVILTGRAIGDGESADVLIDIEIFDDRGKRPPVLIANEIGDGAKNLHAAQLDIAKLAVLKLGRQRPCHQKPACRIDLFRAAQLDRPRSLRSHIVLLTESLFRMQHRKAMRASD